MRILLFFLCLNVSLSAQTVLLEEDFNTCQIPADWSVNLSGNPDAVWYISDEINNENSDGSTIDGSCMVVFDDDATGDNTPDWNLELTTPVFDGTAFSTLNFSADVHFRQIEESFFRISVFDGSEFVEIVRWQGNLNTGEQFSEYTTFTADLSFYANPNMQVRFEFNDGQTWAWWAGLDNVSVTGEGNATNIITADFNNCVLPQGWTTATLLGEDNWQFGTVDNGNAGDNNSLNGTCFAYFDDDGLGEENPPSRAVLLSPPFNGTDYAEIALDMDVILRRYEDLEHLGVYIFDGENSFPVVNYFTDLGGPLFNEYLHERIDLSPFRQETMRVAFLYDDGGGWGWWVGLDNIKISGSGTLNDVCENAVDLTPNQTCVPGTNQNALFIGEQPSCGIRNEGALWYRYQAGLTGITEVISNAEFNDVITVFTGACGALTEIHCYDCDEHGFEAENLLFDAQAGTEYYIRVSGKNENFGIPRGNLCMELRNATAYPVPPTNDACANALPLNIDGDCVASTNLNADFDGDAPSLNTLSRSDIWYTFTAPEGEIEIVSNADFADVITVFSGTCGSFTEVAVNDYGQKLRVADLSVGETYFVQISGFFATIEGSVCAAIQTVEEEEVANDECFDAISLNVGADCYAGSNTGAQISEPRPGCETEYDASVWFEFVAPESGAVNINTGADFVHALSVYSGVCNNLEEVYCANNPSACGGYFKVGSLAAGETYYIQIASAGNHLGVMASGNFCLHLLDGDAMLAPPLELAVGINCTGEGIGTLNVSVSGGTGNYTLIGNADGENITTGTEYMVIVSDDAGCEVSASGTAFCGELDCALAATIIPQNITCFGDADGSLSVETAGAQGNLTYAWSNGAVSSELTNLTPGTYTLTVTDDNACPAVTEVTLTEPAELVAGVIAEDESGFNLNDGSVSAALSGGTPPFVYAWSNGSSAQMQTGLAPGTYSLTVTDMNNCLSVSSAEVAAFGCASAADIISANVTCFGENNGSASLSFTTGEAPYTYAWSNGLTGQSIDNLSPGMYSVTATDASDCPLELSIEITQPELLSAVASATGVTAAGADNGTASANPTGGTGTYTYLWSNNAFTSEITGLAPGNYTVTVSDENNCTSIQTVTVNAFDCAVAASVSTENISCFGETDGTASVQVTTGTSPFTYAWSNGAETESITNLSADNYEVSITDASDCPMVLSFVITEPNPIGLSLSEQINPVCLDGTGSINIVGQGGTGDYSYLWSSGNTEATETDLSPGIYSVTVADVNNCTWTESFEIAATDNINPVVSIEALTLALNASGTVSITPESINNGSFDNCGEIEMSLDNSTFTCDNLGENTVTLTVTDALNNTSTATTTITVIDIIVPELICPPSLTADCSGFAEYEMPTVTDNCETGTPTLIEGLGSSSTFPEGIHIETYQVTDAAGNTAECSFTVTVENPLTTNIEVEKPTCNGDADGSATVFAEGGNNLSYAWDDPAEQTTATATGLAAGVYTVTVTDESGCSIAQTIVVPEPEVLVISVTEVINDSNGQGTGSISVEVSGGEPPYAYEWTQGGNFFSDAPNLEDLNAGDYILQVTDDKDCLLLSEAITVDTETSNTQASLARYFEIFPNPTTGKFFVQIGLPNTRDVELTLYDVTGKTLEVRAFADTQRELLSYDLSHAMSGVYELRAIVGAEVVVFRLVKI